MIFHKKVIGRDGTIEYRVVFLGGNERLHRTDAPAEIVGFGGTSWHFQGVLHREDGPAMLDSDGDQQWRQYDKLHREEGPALNQPRFGYVEYWIDGHIDENQKRKAKERGELQE